VETNVVKLPTKIYVFIQYHLFCILLPEVRYWTECQGSAVHITKSLIIYMMGTNWLFFSSMNAAMCLLYQRILVCHSSRWPVLVVNKLDYCCAIPVLPINMSAGASDPSLYWYICYTSNFLTTYVDPSPRIRNLK
jgi:hypothetical protein